MLGVITVDDVIDVITEEATEDMYHLAGLHEEDRVFVSAGQSVRKRLPWMLTNLATAFLAAWVIGLFEPTLERIVALAIFMPVVAMLAGNGGIQSLTVITRSIALGEIEFSSGLRAAGKELGVGLVVGPDPGVARIHHSFARLRLAARAFGACPVRVRGRAEGSLAPQLRSATRGRLRRPLLARLRSPPRCARLSALGDGGMSSRIDPASRAGGERASRGMWRRYYQACIDTGRHSRN